MLIDMVRWLDTLDKLKAFDLRDSQVRVSKIASMTSAALISKKDLENSLISNVSHVSGSY